MDRLDRSSLVCVYKFCSVVSFSLSLYRSCLYLISLACHTFRWLACSLGALGENRSLLPAPPAAVHHYHRVSESQFNDMNRNLTTRTYGQRYGMAKTSTYRYGLLNRWVKRVSAIERERRAWSATYVLLFEDDW